MAGARRRHRHRPLQHDGARDHPRRADQRPLHRALDDRLRGVPARRSSRGPRRGRAGDGRAGRGHSEMAHAYARADRAILCWTLGITEHVTAVDNVLSLINLSLLTGHVGRYGSGLNPLRGQNNVQGGGDMGAIPNKLPGFQDVQDDRRPAPASRRRGTASSRPSAAGTCRRCSTAWSAASYDALRARREPRAVRGRLQALPRAAGGPGLHDRPGHPDDEDVRDGRRRLPDHGLVVRVGRRHRHQLRAPRAAACARRSTRPARRATTSGSSPSSRSASATTGASRRRSRRGTSCARSARCTPA